MRARIVKCTEKRTVDSVNGPLTTVTLSADGAAFNTDSGSLTFFVHDEDDLKLYEVGRRFRLQPEPL